MFITSIHPITIFRYQAAPDNFKAIVFSSTANKTRLLYELYSNVIPGVPVYQMQSRMTQSARIKTTEKFKTAKSGILFASDVVGKTSRLLFLRRNEY
jgi:ATP-dependent RNA helicase MSS116